MSVVASRGAGLHVVVAGGGVAAVETLLALRAVAGDALRLTLISPDPVFRYRPAATIGAFDRNALHAYDLRAIADDLGVTYERSAVSAVAPAAKWVRLASGARLEYDALVLATGARAQAGVPGALMFRDQRDLPAVQRVLDDVGAGLVDRLLFAVPSGCTWPLPLYELALLSAARVAEGELDSEVSLVTPELQPLDLFGADASRLVAGVLAERGVRFLGGSAPSAVLRDGSLAIAFDASIKADRVVAAPQLRGRRISGVPASWWGFVATDMTGRVQGLDDVYAAGDVTTFPIKQGGLAAQQADHVAHTIAEKAGFPVHRFRPGLVLRARLLGGAQPLFLHTELDQFGRPVRAALERHEHRPPPGSSKIFARYLTPYLEQLTAPAA